MTAQTICPNPNCSYILLDYQVFNSSSRFYRDLGRVPEVQPNPDIAGIGVICAFLVTAYLAFLCLLVSCCFTGGYQHASGLDRATVGPLRRRWPKAVLSERSVKAMKTIVLSLSDQQIVTGIAVLASAIYQIHCGLSAYHWQVVTYLAWMSSTTHLGTLTLLEDYFRENKRMCVVRVSLMVLLAIFVVCAMLFMGFPWWSLGMPVQCYLSALKTSPRGVRQAFSDSNDLDPDRFLNTLFSMMILMLNHVSRISRLIPRASSFWHAMIRVKLGGMAKGLLTFLSRLVESSFLSRSRVRRALLRPPFAFARDILYTFFILTFTIVEIYQSLFFDILWLAFVMVWGSLQVIGIRKEAGLVFDPLTFIPLGQNQIQSQENSWGFGQMMACGIILISIFGALDVLNEQIPTTPSGTPPDPSGNFILGPSPTRKDRFRNKTHTTCEFYQTAWFVPLQYLVTLFGMIVVVLDIFFLWTSGGPLNITAQFRILNTQIPVLIIFWSYIEHGIFIHDYGHVVYVLIAARICHLLGIPKIGSFLQDQLRRRWVAVFFWFCYEASLTWVFLFGILAWGQLFWVFVADLVFVYLTRYWMTLR